MRSADVEGTIELIVAGDDGEHRYTVTLHAGEPATIRESAAESPAASVSGEQSGWVRAFSPAEDRGGLAITGDARLASVLLDALALGHAGASAGVERAA